MKLSAYKKLRSSLLKSKKRRIITLDNLVNVVTYDKSNLIKHDNKKQKRK